MSQGLLAGDGLSDPTGSVHAGDPRMDPDEGEQKISQPISQQVTRGEILEQGLQDDAEGECNRSGGSAPEEAKEELQDRIDNTSCPTR